MPQQPSLLTLQHWLQAVVTHPEGIAKGIASSDAQSRIPVPPGAINSVVLPSKALSSEQRLAVYGNAYFGRLLECMREMFPVLRYALEDDVFDQFALGYLTTHPPHSYTLENLSDRFLAFLTATRNEIAKPDESWPDFVIDLARLEWNIDRVFDGPGVEHQQLFSAEDLQRIDPQQWPAATLTAAPCLRLLAFRFPVNNYYTAFRELAPESEDSLPLPPEQKNYLALTRRNYVVRRYPLGETQYDLLTALLEGKAVGDAIEVAAEQCDDLDLFAQDLGRWFQAWTRAEFFVSVDVPEAE